MTSVMIMVLLIPLAWWALQPVETTVPRADTTELLSVEITPRAAAPDAPFDASVFNITLWHVPQSPPAPVETTSPRSPQPVLRIELLGISSANDHLSAWLLDPAEDEIRSVREGEQFGRFTVQQVTDRSITIHDGTRPHTLVLMDPTAAP